MMTAALRRMWKNALVGNKKPVAQPLDAYYAERRNKTHLRRHLKVVLSEIGLMKLRTDLEQGRGNIEKTEATLRKEAKTGA